MTFSFILLIIRVPDAIAMKPFICFLNLQLYELSAIWTSVVSAPSGLNLWFEPSDLISSGSNKIYDFDELMNWEIYDFDELMNGEIYDFDELLIWQLYGLETFHLVNFQNLDSCYNKNMF